VAPARFFIDAELAAGRRVDLPHTVAHHAAHVLRLRDGDPVVVFNGRGGEYSAKLTERGTAADIAAFDAVEREAPLLLTLVQAWVALDKIDWIVEKSVELGVARILLAPARRSVVRFDSARLDQRVARLRNIAIAACCQSGRNRVPAVIACDSLASALSAALEGGGRGVLMHPQAADGLLAAVGASERVAVAIGPEGGFDDAELADAARAGFDAVRLGPRVLRTETAGLAAMTTLLAAAGDFR
jgi:16S rRNA (uracil1498-N3)-methyltransferase